MFTKRSWESFYSGLVMVGLVFMVFPVIYFCGATKEKQILPPLIMFLLGLVIFVISVHFSVKYHKEKTKYTKYKIDKSLTYTFTLTYGDKVETVTDFSQIEYAIKWLAKYRTGHVEIAVTPTMGSRSGTSVHSTVGSDAVWTNMTVRPIAPLFSSVSRKKR